MAGGVPMLYFFIYFCLQVGQQSRTPVWFSAFAIMLLMTTLVGVLGVVYWANQLAVRGKLEPLREQLQAALTRLDDESTSAGQ